VPEAAARGFEVRIGGPGYGTTWISFNQDYGLNEGDPTKDRLRGLFRDVRFRRAVAHAMDRESIIQSLYYGLADPQWSPVSVPSPFYAGRDCYGCPTTESAAVIYEYDPVEASRLLDEIGIVDLDGDGYREFEDGTTVEFVLETNAGNSLREGFCLILAHDLDALGLRVIYRPIDFNTLVTRLLGGCLYQAAVVGLAGGNDPNGGAGVYRTTGGLHFWHYSAPDEPYAYELRIDELFDLGIATLDSDEAFEYYREFQILYATSDLGLLFSVNEQILSAIYTYMANRQLADGPFAAPHAGNGVSWDLYWLRKPSSDG
jgi:peptide/nickel transport system substrate-binding protein